MADYSELDIWRSDPWWPAINRCHEALVAIDPDYRINQIKEKFGGLRYYYSTYLDDPYLRTAMNQCVRDAEIWCDGFEAGRQHRG